MKPMETTIKSKKITVTDYLKLPEGAPFELIEGNLVKVPAREYGHQDVVTLLVSRMRIFADEYNLGKVVVAPTDVYLDDENVFQPDILFVAKENLVRIERDGIHGPPDLVIEILSPNNAYHDFTIKFHHYEKHGVKEYFIVDPETKEAVAYSLTDGKFKEAYREKGIIRSDILKTEFIF